MKHLLPLFTFYFLLLTSSSAVLAPARILTDNMVLQRGQPIPIWGTGASPNSPLTATLNAGTTTLATGNSTAKPDGTWLLHLPKIDKPVTTPLTLTITNGNSTLTLKNLLVGDVWLCSGQSNLTLSVAHNANIDPERPWSWNQDRNYRLPDYDPEIDPLIRHFGMEKTMPQNFSEPQDEIPDGFDGDPYKENTWKPSSPENTGEFTATGYYFARAYRAAKLRNGENIPIGIIRNGWGGTPIEPWMSLETQLSRPDFVEKRADMLPKTNPPKTPQNVPSSCYNTRIHPLRHLALRGVIWNQGESNAGASDLYRSQLPAMIAQWRTLFNNPGLPFYITEIPAIPRSTTAGENQFYPLLRKAQQLIAAKTPHTHLVPALDLGSFTPTPKNTDLEIHQRTKHLLGPRIALIVRATLDHEHLFATTPKPISTTTTNGTLSITFNTPLSTNDNLPPRALEIAGPDGHYRLPDTIQFTNGNTTLLLSNKTIKNPLGVRHAWSNQSSANSQKSSPTANEYPPPANLCTQQKTECGPLPLLSFRIASIPLNHTLTGNTTDPLSDDRHLYQRTLNLARSTHTGTSTKQPDANVTQTSKSAPSPAQTTGQLPPTPGTAAPSDYSLVTSRYSLLDDGTALARTIAAQSESITYHTTTPITDFIITALATPQKPHTPLNPYRRIYLSASTDGKTWSNPVPPFVASAIPIDGNSTTHRLTLLPAGNILNGSPTYLKIILAGYLTETSTQLQQVQLITGTSPVNLPYPTTTTNTTLSAPKQPDANVAQAAQPAPLAAHPPAPPPSTPGAAAPSDYSLVTSRYSLVDDGAAAALTDPFDNLTHTAASSPNAKIGTANPINNDTHRLTLATNTPSTLTLNNQPYPGLIAYKLSGQTKLTLTIFHYGAKALTRLSAQTTTGSSTTTTNLPLKTKTTTPAPNAKGWHITTQTAQLPPTAEYLILDIAPAQPIWATQLSTLTLE